MFDGMCLEVLDKSPNAIVAWYLMASYAYYHEDDPILSDEVFDWLCVRFLENWNAIKHPHKHLTDEGQLKCGTLLLGKDDYPSMVKGALSEVRKQKSG
jgi:hypothetical protein